MEEPAEALSTTEPALVYCGYIVVLDTTIYNPLGSKPIAFPSSEWKITGHHNRHSQSILHRRREKTQNEKKAKKQ